MTNEHREEGLSAAFMLALAAQAGCNIRLNDGADYGVDGAFKLVLTRFDKSFDKDGQPKLTPRRYSSGHSIEFQAKASTTWEKRDGKIIYRLEVKNYNDLVHRAKESSGTPLMLVLLCLPKDQGEWVNSSEDQLLLRHACYWFAVSKEAEPTENSSKATIEIPTSNRLTSEKITEILDGVRQGVAL